jgi:TRAP-type C4-dicarboxylate transport system substrate-binding protein
VLTQPIKLSLNSQYNTVQIIGRGIQWFANRVGELSGGMMKVTVYPSGTLSETPKIYESVVAGIADIGNHSFTTTPNLFPVSEMTNLPNPFPTAYVSSKTSNDFFKYAQPAEYKNIHYLYGTDCGPIAWCSTNPDKPLNVPSDIQGLKIRASGTIGTSIVKAYGGTGIYVPPSDIYDVASKHIVDALFIPVEMLKGWNLADVVYSVTMPPLLTTSSNFNCMNLAKWNSLPKAAQDILTQASEEAAEVAARAWWYGDFQSIDFFLSKPGRTIITPTEEQMKLWADPIQFIRDDYIKNLDAKGLKGTELMKWLEEHAAEVYKAQPDKATVKAFIESDAFPK